MTVMGEAIASPTADFITNDWPSGATTCSCLFTGAPGVASVVANRASGVPGSAKVPLETRRIGTAVSGRFLRVFQGAMDASCASTAPAASTDANAWRSVRA